MRWATAARFGARIRYSPESPALETAGGIAHALPLLGDEPFVVVSGDIHTAFDFATLAARIEAIAREPERLRRPLRAGRQSRRGIAAGDMGLAQGRVTRARPALTYGNIAVFHPRIFARHRTRAPGSSSSRGCTASSRRGA